MAFSKPVSMELDDEEKFDAVQPIKMSDKPDFPYGLRICLTHVELAKLHLDIADCERGDCLDIVARCRVTDRETRDGPGGPSCRVELQIETIEDMADDC
jgi:hypothetical protein